VARPQAGPTAADKGTHTHTYTHTHTHTYIYNTQRVVALLQAGPAVAEGGTHVGAGVEAGGAARPLVGVGLGLGSQNGVRSTEVGSLQCCSSSKRAWVCKGLG
jgi:hypothetical protein